MFINREMEEACQQFGGDFASVGKLTKLKKLRAVDKNVMIFIMQKFCLFL